MSMEALCRAVHHRSSVLAGLAAVDCVGLPRLAAKSTT